MKVYKVWLLVEEYDPETEEGTFVGLGVLRGEYNDLETAELFAQSVLGLSQAGEGSAINNPPFD